MEDNSFALELVREYSKQAKKWFVLAVVELVIIIGIVVGFLFFMSNFELASTDVTSEGEGIDNYVNVEGDISSGGIEN